MAGLDHNKLSTMHIALWNRRCCMVGVEPQYLGKCCLASAGPAGANTQVQVGIDLAGLEPGARYSD
jgi:hypothetical protein